MLSEESQSVSLSTFLYHGHRFPLFPAVRRHTTTYATGHTRENEYTLPMHMDMLHGHTGPHAYSARVRCAGDDETEAMRPHRHKAVERAQAGGARLARLSRRGD